MSVRAPTSRSAALFFHHGTVAAQQRAQPTAVASVFVDDGRLVRAGTLHYLSQAALLQPARLAAFTSFGIDLKDHHLASVAQVNVDSRSSSRFPRSCVIMDYSLADCQSFFLRCLYLWLFI